MKTFKGRDWIIEFLSYTARIRGKGLIVTDTLLDYLKDMQVVIDIGLWAEMKERARVIYVLDAAELNCYLPNPTDANFECVPRQHIADAMKAIIESKCSYAKYKTEQKTKQDKAIKRRGRPRKSE